MSIAPTSGLRSAPRILMVAPRWPCVGLLAEGLAREGCEVHRLLDLRGVFAPSDPGAQRRLFSWPDRRFSSTTRIASVFNRSFFDVIDGLVRSRGIDFVLPVLEPALYEMWKRPEAPWAPLVRPHIEPWQQTLLLSKWSMSEAARGWGVDIPRQYSATDPEAVQAAVADLGLPVVVKDVVGGGGTRVVICSTLAEVTAAISRLEATGHPDSDQPPMLQEYVPGTTYLAFGLFDDGRAVRLYAGAKVEQDPPGVGPSAVIRSVMEPELTESTLRVFAGLKWTGLAGADFVRRPDGSFAFLEVNPRPSATLGAGLEAGVELAGPYAEILRGGHPAADLSLTPDLDYRIPISRVLAHFSRGSAREVAAVLRDRPTWDAIPWGDRGEVTYRAIHRVRNDRRRRQQNRPDTSRRAETENR